jgi:hypothetical protein
MIQLYSYLCAIYFSAPLVTVDQVIEVTSPMRLKSSEPCDVLEVGCTSTKMAWTSRKGCFLIGNLLLPYPNRVKTMLCRPARGHASLSCGMREL